MRTYCNILIIALLALASPAAAQNMEVVGFQQLTNDITAISWGSTKLDANGETTALVKLVVPDTQGFTVDGGATGIVDVEMKSGEIWLYVPKGSTQLSINHRLYGSLKGYKYPVGIQSGCTYEMLVDIGTGRFVTISSSQVGASITMDGDTIGQSPLLHAYMPYGQHQLTASVGKHYGKTSVTLSSNDSVQQQVINIDMEDLSLGEGFVTVTAAEGTAIFFRGDSVAEGTWHTSLPAGQYQIEARRADCQPATTSFTVVAKQENNVKANEPQQLRGWLNVYSKTKGVKATCDGKAIRMGENMLLPIGVHNVVYKTAGYRYVFDYNVKHNHVTKDTVRLERRHVYLGPIYDIVDNGVGGVLGFCGIWNFELSCLKYTSGKKNIDFGLSLGHHQVLGGGFHLVPSLDLGLTFLNKEYVYRTIPNDAPFYAGKTLKLDKTEQILHGGLGMRLSYELGAIMVFVKPQVNININLMEQTANEKDYEEEYNIDMSTKLGLISGICFRF